MHTEAVVVTSNNNPPYLQACQIWPDHSQIASSGPAETVKVKVAICYIVLVTVF